MSQTVDSVYADLLKAGLGKLGHLDARRELLALFSALEHFRRELHEQESALDILQVSQRYVAGLNLFRSQGFWLVNPGDFNFEPALVEPVQQKAVLERIITHEIRNRRFAWALRQNAPVFFHAGTKEEPEEGLLHSLALSNQVVGMFCGLLHRQLAPNQEITFSLLSLLLGSSADALATLRKTAQLTDQIKTLSDLLPICAWCKKVRNDSGYWEQLEKYLSMRSLASFTHGVCPDCEKQLLADMDRRAPSGP
jgi:hypothetical protein